MLDDFTLTAIGAGGALLLLVALLIFVWIRRRRAMQTPYEVVESVLTPIEQAVLAALMDAVGSDETVFARLPVADVLLPPSQLPRAVRQRLIEKALDARFDFIVCSKNAGEPRLAIELDDHHDRAAERKARALSLPRTCREAGLPLLHWPAGEQPTAAALRHRMAELLHPTEAVDAAGYVRPDGRREPILDLPDDPVDGGR